MVMCNMTLCVVDNFYQDPDQIRNYALSLQYSRRDNAPYPGREAFSDRDWSDIIKKIMSLIPESTQIEHVRYPKYPQGKFHLALASDHQTRGVGVHVDIPKWSTVIY